MRRTDGGRRGLTFVELTICLVILSYLVVMAVPLTENTDRRMRELAARTSLREMRKAIDRYHELELSRASGVDDRAAYPKSLGELVDRRLLRKVPPDPLTGSADWVVLSTTDDTRSGHRLVTDGQNVFDVRTRASGRTLDGIDYADL
ncbi:MAG: general secretion pathway protein GspG [Candidatus Riflebacteria bacterium]|nr:general secretion pathway protein GspG [Candidatus Riflebacteria bacterium]